MGGTGTGTGTGTCGVVLGAANCVIYRIVEGKPGCDNSRLVPISDLSKRIYNLSEAAIAGNAWLLVHRDKFGQWIAGLAVGGDSSCEGETKDVWSYETRCINGRNQKFVSIHVFKDGCFLRTEGPFYIGDEGCCECDDEIGTGTGSSFFGICCEPLPYETLCATIDVIGGSCPFLNGLVVPLHKFDGISFGGNVGVPGGPAPEVGINFGCCNGGIVPEPDCTKYGLGFSFRPHNLVGCGPGFAMDSRVGGACPPVAGTPNWCIGPIEMMSCSCDPHEWVFEFDTTFPDGGAGCIFNTTITRIRVTIAPCGAGQEPCGGYCRYMGTASGNWILFDKQCLKGCNCAPPPSWTPTQLVIVKVGCVQNEDIGTGSGPVMP